jgi:hypothetical protein
MNARRDKLAELPLMAKSVITFALDAASAPTLVLAVEKILETRLRRLEIFGDCPILTTDACRALEA